MAGTHIPIACGIQIPSLFLYVCINISIYSLLHLLGSKYKVDIFWQICSGDFHMLEHEPTFYILTNMYMFLSCNKLQGQL